MHACGDYEISVLGQLDPSWEAWLNASRSEIVNNAHGSQMTFLFRDLDQAALHGILAKIRNLNLPLLSVTRLQRDRRS